MAMKRGLSRGWGWAGGGADPKGICVIWGKSFLPLCPSWSLAGSTFQAEWGPTYTLTPYGTSGMFHAWLRSGWPGSRRVGHVLGAGPGNPVIFLQDLDGNKPPNWEENWEPGAGVRDSEGWGPPEFPLSGATSGMDPEWGQAGVVL